MVNTEIILAFLWIACMLTYLLGDVIRVFSGSFTPGEIDGRQVSQTMWFGVAIVMVIPIIMVVLSILLPFPLNGWISIIVAIFFILFNLMGIKGYKPFDKFLLIVSFGFNIITIWIAWTVIFTP